MAMPHRVLFEFFQEGNTMGTTAETERLSIVLQDATLDGEFFYELKSETGWSMDDPQELKDILNRCHKALEALK